MFLSTGSRPFRARPLPWLSRTHDSAGECRYRRQLVCPICERQVYYGYLARSFGLYKICSPRLALHVLYSWHRSLKSYKCEPLELIIYLLVEVDILVIEFVDFVVVLYGWVFIVLRIRVLWMARLISIYKNVDSRPLLLIFLAIGLFWKSILAIRNVIVKEFIVTVALNFCLLDCSLSFVRIIKFSPFGKISYVIQNNLFL